MTRVLVAAASPVVRAGLEALVRAGAGTAAGELPFEVVGSVAGDAAAVGDAVERLRPDVVLLEVERQGDAPGGGSLAPAAVLAAVASGDAPRAAPAAVLLAEEADGAWAADALRSGARAVLPRGASASEIVAAVEAAAAGLVVIHPDLADALLPALPRAVPPPPNGTQTLTPREVEVLGMLAEGLPNKQIAPRLGITEHTVKYHIASIFAKLGASSRTEAVTIGARRGLVML
jgi:DNA-binding NarL/FixJ family response regulator